MAALPAPAEEAPKEVGTLEKAADEGLEGAESGYYGGWGRRKWNSWE